MTDAANVLMCRTCGRPRGENIANGTRCARCGHRQAAMLSIAVALGAANAAFLSTFNPRHALAAAVVGLIAAAPAWVLTLLTHELTHAVTAFLLGQRVTRVLVGEGRPLWRIGRDPQLVIGSVLMGNGLTNVMDLCRRGYRGRMAAMSLAAPAASAAIGLLVLIVGVGGPMPIKTAAAVFAYFSLALAVISLIPVPTFGGRVWSDLAFVLYLRRAGERDLEEQMLLSAQDRIALLLDAGLPERAIDTARAAVEAVPSAPLAYSLLAYSLHRTGHLDEADAVARSALGLAGDEASRAYLRQFLGTPSE